MIYPKKKYKRAAFLLKSSALQAVKKASLKLLGCMKGPQPLHFYAPRYCLTASAGFGR